MIRYRQLIQKHDPDQGLIGDCFRTCIGSILEIHPSHIPHFVERIYHPKEMSLVQLVNDVNEWLHETGLQYIDVTIPNDTGFLLNRMGYHIITGKSARNNDVDHCVVGLNGKVVHDPHSSDLGIMDDYNQYGFFIGVLT